MTPHSSRDDDAWARVSAVVVTHHSAAVIGECLGALSQAGQIVIVDNASDDDTLAIVADAAPRVRIIANARGVGYGNAVNQAFAHVDREFALLANPDSVLRPGAIAALVGAADTWPDAALFGMTILTPDGRVEPSHDVVLFERRRYGGRRHETLPEGPCCVNYVSGAVTLVRASAMRTLGGFDPAFFLYYEDDDFCLRLRRAGHAIVLVPAAVAVHVGGGSVRPSAHYYWEKFWNMSWSRLYFETKHRGRAAGLALALRQALRLLAKIVAASLVFDRKRVWRDAARLAGTLAYVVGIRASRVRA
jgi:N-acetylglucosaminyl-diphospho-decaprenol L-rhamnosyltransferase